MSEATLLQRMRETQKIIKTACEGFVRHMEQTDPKWSGVRKRRDALMHELIERQQEAGGE